MFQFTDDDPGRWTLVLDVLNLQTVVGEDTDIEAVAYGPGI